MRSDACESVVFSQVTKPLTPEGVVTDPAVTGPAATEPAVGGPSRRRRVLILGLCWKAVPADRLELETDTLATRLIERPTKAMVAARRLVDRSLGSTLESQLAAEAESQGDLGHSADYREGVRAFLADLQPQAR